MVEGTPGTEFADEVTIRRIRFAAPDDSFAVIEAERDGDEITLVGPVAHLEERERVAVAGTWQDDKRFGMQVRVRTAQPLAPSGAHAVLAYLRRVKHVGPGRAAKLYDRHGDDVLDAIDVDPRVAFKAAGLSARQAGEAVASWDTLRSQRALHLLLAPHGLAWLVPRIDRHYGPRAHRVVKEQPYELTSVFGVGFETADRIAGRRRGPERTAAALLHVLSEAERDGSTCLPEELARRRTADLTGGDAPDADQLDELEAGRRITREAGYVYRPATAALEAELARRVKDLLEERPSRRFGDGPPEPTGDELTPAPEQWTAVEHAFAHRLSIV